MQRVILYDAECGFCQRSIRFVWSHDRLGRFHFAALRSEFARRLLAERGLPEPDLRTFYLVDGDRVLERSDAALAIASQLEHPVKHLAAFRAVPTPLRNAVYAFIAVNRHLLPGDKSCELPPPDVRERFLA